jgi:HAD superfamily hydrolase (TIGR01509 family)
MLENGFKAKCIFLDLDGTIVDSTEAYIEAARISFQAIGQAAPTKENALEIPRRLEQGISINDITYGESEKFLKTYLKTYYLVTPQKTKLIPNVKAALEALAKKRKLTLITMRYVPKKSIIEELEFFGISKYFSHVVTALDSFKPKPSPEALLSCVRTMDVDISDCVIAGDSVNDVRAGKAAGARTVAVLSGLFRSGELEKEEPDLILNDVTALPDLIG